MVLKYDEKIANEVRELRDYTKHTTFKVRYNYKMTDMEAALGICQIKKLDQFIVKRKLILSQMSLIFYLYNYLL